MLRVDVKALKFLDQLCRRFELTLRAIAAGA